MIWKFTYENFKSFEKAEFSVQQLTTMIGTNASGKSNAIEGIWILSMLASGIDLSVVLDGTQNLESYVRGGSQGCKRFRTSAFKLGCRMTSYEEDRDLLYEVKIGINGRIVIEEEGLYLIDHNSSDSRAEKIFRTKSPAKESSDIKVEYSNGARGRNPDILCTRTASVLTQMVNRIPRASEDEICNAHHMEKAIETLRNVMILNPDPAVMREYSRINDKELRMDCKNISAVLMDLCKDPIKKKTILSFMHRLPENEVEDISFIRTKIGDVIFALKERYINSSELVDAKKLSDGTLRSIAIISAMLSAHKDSLVIIEEIDNGVHPARLIELIKEIYELARKGNCDIIMTTHNAAMLDRYMKDELAGVIVVYRESAKGTSRFLTVTEIAELPEFVLGGGLGTAMIEQKLLNAIKGKKRRKSIKWMEEAI
ncbi:MAG: AAA family ATPase [Lachnospiraceae bacterium]|nr:AAA family ATPase [Lachnospiraceae bacterium]